MAEILFRGKRIDNGKWVYGYYEFYNDKHYINVQTDRLNSGGYPIREFIEVIPETVGQYTGSTDKNGKKIFEGDIVKVTYQTRNYYILTEIKEVSYNEKECCYYPMRWNESCEICDYFTEIQSIEIIGNIHDNPELLKGE